MILYKWYKDFKLKKKNRQVVNLPETFDNSSIDMQHRIRIKLVEADIPKMGAFYKRIKRIDINSSPNIKEIMKITKNHKNFVDVNKLELSVKNKFDKYKMKQLDTGLSDISEKVSEESRDTFAEKQNQWE